MIMLAPKKPDEAKTMNLKKNDAGMVAAVMPPQGNGEKPKNTVKETGGKLNIQVQPERPKINQEPKNTGIVPPAKNEKTVHGSVIDRLKEKFQSHKQKQQKERQ